LKGFIEMLFMQDFSNHLKNVMNSGNV